MATIQGKLSPLIKSVQTRRKSLEIYQKAGIGGKLLASNSPTTPTPNSTQSEVFFGRTPEKNSPASKQQYSLLNQSFSEQFLQLNTGQNSFQKESPITKRRGSDSLSQFCVSRFSQKSPGTFKTPTTKSPFVIPTIKIDLEDKDEKRAEEKPKTVQNSSKEGRKFSLPHVLSNECLNAVSLRYKIDFCDEEILGRGAFGTVVSALYKSCPVAIKIVSTRTKFQKESLEREKNILQLGYHANIILLLDIMRPSTKYAFLIMERLQRGSLFSMINDGTQDIPFNLVFKCTRQIVQALMHCHQHQLIHLDVKPQNILLDGNNNCKLADFGNSQLLTSSNTNNIIQGGTTAYKAPELFCGKPPTDKCDIYSLGVTMWQMHTRRVPYAEQADHSIIYQVVAQNLRPDTNSKNTKANYLNSPASEIKETKKLDSTCQKYKALYKKCWEQQPSLRPDIYQVLNYLNSIRSPVFPLQAPTIKI